MAAEGGAIVTRLGPTVRRGEEQPVTHPPARIGMPKLRIIHGSGIIDTPCRSELARE